MFKSIKLSTGLLLFCIVLIAGFIRIAGLGTHLPSMHRDELGIAYNAYSLVLTARDEHGVGPFPINFKSFGDYKLPGTIYLTAAGIKLLGLSVFSVRLPNAIFATALIPLAYFFALELFQKKRIAIFSALFSCLSFWHIHNSRNIYEPIIGLTFSIAVVLSLLKARKHNIWLIPALILSVVSFFFYNAPLILLPFMFLIFFAIFFKEFARSNIFLRIGGGLLFIVLAMFSILTLGGVNKSRINTTVFTNLNTYAIAEHVHYLHVAGVPFQAARIFMNKGTMIIIGVLRGYFSAFNLQYLFVGGNSSPWHSLENIFLGNENLFILPLSAIGLFAIAYRAYKKSREAWFFLLFLAVSPIANAVTIDVPSINRLMDFHFLLLVGAAYGVEVLLSLPRKKNLYNLFGKLMLAGYALHFVFFAVMYTYLYPKNLHLLWYSKVPDVVKLVQEKIHEVDAVYVTENIDLGYIYFAFYSKYDPKLFQQEADWYEHGFSKVASFGKYIFFDGPGKGTAMTPEIISKYFQNGRKKVMVVAPYGAGGSLEGREIVLNEDKKTGWEIYFVERERE